MDLEGGFGVSLDPFASQVRSHWTNHPFLLSTVNLVLLVDLLRTGGCTWLIRAWAVTTGPETFSKMRTQWSPFLILDAKAWEYHVQALIGLRTFPSPPLKLLAFSRPMPAFWIVLLFDFRRSFRPGAAHQDKRQVLCISHWPALLRYWVWALGLPGPQCTHSVKKVTNPEVPGRAVPLAVSLTVWNRNTTLKFSFLFNDFFKELVIYLMYKSSW